MPYAPAWSPIRKVAHSLRGHRDLILNWFIAKKQISAATVEGMNTNAKLALRKARGFRTFEVLETALYHELGHLPEPLSVTPTDSVEEPNIGATLLLNEP